MTQKFGRHYVVLTKKDTLLSHPKALKMFIYCLNQIQLLQTLLDLVSSGTINQVA